MRSGVRGLTLGADAPIDDLGLVHVELPVVQRRQARRVADRTIDVDQPVTGATDEMMVIVTNSPFVPRGGACWLDPADDLVFFQNRQRVVDGLAGDRSDLLADDLSDVGRAAVRVDGYRPQHSQPLSSYLETVVAELLSRIDGHGRQPAPDSGLRQGSGRYRTIGATGHDTPR